MNYSLLTVGGINRAIVRSSAKVQEAVWQGHPEVLTLWWGMLYDPIQVTVLPGDTVTYFHDHRGEVCFESVRKADKETQATRDEVG